MSRHWFAANRRSIRRDARSGGPHGQLYDIAKDPTESVNVYLQHPDVVARLTALLDRYQQEVYSRAMP